MIDGLDVRALLFFNEAVFPDSLAGEMIKDWHYLLLASETDQHTQTCIVVSC